ncbi:dirigent protein [Nocardia cyriacigeorgica]|uniref:allene oxide cyclase barrel-like domain-containing protein n=1 Tax=Nocardia cyriacigeorgica TaxID=135487 RepID=UPI0013BDD625|nr:dirigent protein [Nocardia cyriacigeorgica]NEW51382.1 dirigent protein [Nocardia cyriacigeorgica]
MLHAHSTRAMVTAAFGVLLVSGGLSACSTDTSETAVLRQRVEIIEAAALTDQLAVLDLDKPGVSLGDMAVYSGDIEQDGRAIGHGGGTCQNIHIEGDEITMQCVLTAQLERGSLTMQAVWVQGASPLDLAITGGTGAYRSATGTARFWEINTPNERMRAEVTLLTQE